jgi:hypothetical protein
LPGETWDSFAEGFDRLMAIGPQEIQLGILKRLRGTPIARHTGPFEMVYDDQPPYVVRQTKDLDATSLERFTRMAKYWDLIANSGRFKTSLPLILSPLAEPASAFKSFMHFSDHVWLSAGKTYGLTPEDLVDAVFDYLTAVREMDSSSVRASLLQDYLASGARARPKCLAHERLPLGGEPTNQNLHEQSGSTAHKLRGRQDRHGVTVASTD